MLVPCYIWYMRYPKEYVSTYDAGKYGRERRRKRIEQGLCTRCDNPAQDGRKDCASCIAETKERIRRSRGERKSRGECIQCGRPARTDALRCQRCSNRMNSLSRTLQKERKTAALEHYGKNGRALCCWDGCEISDIDMLTLDHIANNGAEHRRSYSKTGRGGGTALYLMLEKQGYPPGYQTLCANHNLKKHILEIKKVKR